MTSVYILKQASLESIGKYADMISGRYIVRCHSKILPWRQYVCELCIRGAHRRDMYKINECIVTTLSQDSFKLTLHFIFLNDI